MEKDWTLRCSDELWRSFRVWACRGTRLSALQSPRHESCVQVPQLARDFFAKVFEFLTTQGTRRAVDAVQCQCVYCALAENQKGRD